MTNEQQQEQDPRDEGRDSTQQQPGESWDEASLAQDDRSSGRRGDPAPRAPGSQQPGASPEMEEDKEEADNPEDKKNGSSPTSADTGTGRK
jgi:hypothetical protein